MAAELGPAAGLVHRADQPVEGIEGGLVGVQRGQMGDPAFEDEPVVDQPADLGRCRAVRRGLGDGALRGPLGDQGAAGPAAPALQYTVGVQRGERPADGDVLNGLLMLFPFLVIAFFVLLSLRHVVQLGGAGALADATPFANHATTLAGISAGAAIAAYSFLGFGAFTFVNLSVLATYLRRCRAGDRPRVLPYVVAPVIGAAVDIWLLVHLDTKAQLLGLAWLVIGIAYLAHLTKGFRRPPPKRDLTEDSRTAAITWSEETPLTARGPERRRGGTPGHGPQDAPQPVPLMLSGAMTKSTRSSLRPPYQG